MLRCLEVRDDSKVVDAPVPGEGAMDFFPTKSDEFAIPLLIPRQVQDAILPAFVVAECRLQCGIALFRQKSLHLQCYRMRLHVRDAACESDLAGQT